jgi:hypothetical protein
VRTAALAIATKQLKVLQRPYVRILWITTVSLGALCTVLTAIDGYGWHPLIPAVGTLAVASQLDNGRRLRAGIRRLSADVPA